MCPAQVMGRESASGSRRWPMEGIKSKLMCVDYRRAGLSPCSIADAPAGARNERREGGP